MAFDLTDLTQLREAWKFWEQNEPGKCNPELEEFYTFTL